MALNDNQVIENALGKQDLICVDDLVHELHTVGPKFDTVVAFLAPFKLNRPSGGWHASDTTKHTIDGQEFGCKEEQINELLRKMI